ncbi:MAG: hypothetical protein JXD23_04105 [Spirochaetales bacterium]|nr:hypothetical protein [Spirochaetales bacterium]
MSKKNTGVFIFAVSDSAVGVLSFIFIVFGSLILPQITPLDPTSTLFLKSLGFSAIILIAGIVNLMRSSYGAVLTFAVSFLVGINSLAELLSKSPPAYLAADVPSALTFFFRYIVPSSAIAYFAAHSLVSFIAMKKNKAEEEPVAAAPREPHREKFCAACQALLKETDDVCPSCGALIDGWRCADCGFEGRKKEFRDERCPRCGHKLPPTQE